MKTETCKYCQGKIDPCTTLAYEELYGGYRVDLLKFATALELVLDVYEEHRKRYPHLYPGPLTDEQIGACAIESWLGWALEDAVSAARHRKQEETENRL